MTQSYCPSPEFEVLLDAMCGDELTVGQSRRLEEIVTSNDDDLWHYLCHVHLHGTLHWNIGQPTRQIDVPWGDTVDRQRGRQEGEPLESGFEIQVPDAELSIPSFPSLSTTRYSLPAPFVGSPVFSYMVATLFLGVMLLGAWAYKITHFQPQFVEVPPRSVTSDVRPEMVFVGRITGMVDVKWSDDKDFLPPLGYAYVPLGRKYKLDVGLIQITYDSGAKVILEGPCTYEVESRAGGYLSLGKLTAKVETFVGKGSRSKAEPSSFILHPSSLFSIRTPTAIITDLGTEFGVEVSQNGNTVSHVFRGSVKVRAIGNDGQPDVVLRKNESARVELNENRVPMVRRIAVSSEGFTRRMPELPPVVLLRDTFENQTESDTYGKAEGYGLNEDLSKRQSGLLRPVYYVRRGDCVTLPQLAQVGHAICRGKLNLFARYGQTGWVVLNRNFPRNVEVAAELAPDVLRHPESVLRRAGRTESAPGDPSSDNWLALGVRGQGIWFDHRELLLASDAGAVFQVRANGKWGYFENGKLVCEGRVSPAHPYRVVMRVVGDRLNIQVNGSAIDLDADGPETARTLPGLLAETKDNFITLGACNTDASTSPGWRVLNSVDNLTIRSARRSEEQKGEQPMNGP